MSWDEMHRDICTEYLQKTLWKVIVALTKFVVFYIHTDKWICSSLRSYGWLHGNCKHITWKWNKYYCQKSGTVYWVCTTSLSIAIKTKSINERKMCQRVNILINIQIKMSTVQFNEWSVYIFLPVCAITCFLSV